MIFNSMQQCRKILEYGPSQYVSNRGNWIEILQLALFIVMLIMIIIIAERQAGLNIVAGSTEFADFETIMMCAKYLQLLLGILVITQTFKGLVILRLIPSIDPSMQAIGQTLTDGKVLQFLAF